MQIDVYGSAEELDAIQWEALVAGCPYADLFSTPVFIRTWCRHFGSAVKVRLIAMRDKGQLVGLAPMMIGASKYGGMAVRALSLLHNRHVSRSTILALPGYEPKVFQALTDQWGAMRPQWDVLRLVDVPAPSGVLEQVKKALDRTRMTVYPIETSRRLWGMAINSTWKDHVATCSKKFRANLRLYANRMQRRADIRVEVHRSGPDVRKSMSEMFDLQNRSWKSQDREVCLTPQEQAFTFDWLEQITGGGGVENWLMYAGDRLIGGLHTLIYRQVQYFMLMFYEQASSDVAPGRYLFGRAIEEAFDSGKIKYIDFNGDSEFVQVWATNAVDHEAMSVCHQGLYSRLISGLKRIKRFSTGGLKRQPEAQLMESP